MKKLLIFLLLLTLTACAGLFDAIDAVISITAKQTFIAASGNAIEVREANAVAPVQVKANVERDINGLPTGRIYFSIGTQCEQSWDISTVENYDAFWLDDGSVGTPKSWYVTYDSAESQCVNRRCGGAYSGAMDAVVPQLGVVTIECYTP